MSCHDLQRTKWIANRRWLARAGAWKHVSFTEEAAPNFRDGGLNFLLLWRWGVEGDDVRWEAVIILTWGVVRLMTED